MNENYPATWHEANRDFLMAALCEVRLTLEKLCGQNDSPIAPNHNSEGPEAPNGAAWSLPTPPSLETLCAAFNLSSFERKVLLLCAGIELDSRFSALYAAAHKDPHRSHPTFSLALAAFGDAHWSALSLARPLRHFHLIEVIVGDALTTSPLRIDERVLHYLAGVQSIDERLRSIVRPITAPGPLVPSHQAVAEQIAAAWSQARPQSSLPIMQFCGDDSGSKRAVAAAASTLLGLQLHILPARAIPSDFSEISTFLRLWEREAVLSSSALLIECDETEGPETLLESTVAHLLESIRSPLFISTRSPRRFPHRSVTLLEVNKPTAAEQDDIWRSALDAVSANLNGALTALVSQFSLSSSTIFTVTDQVLRASPQDQEPANGHDEAETRFASRLWEACRIQARPRLEGLAQRIEPTASWDDLVVPEKQKHILHQIAIHVHQRARVYHSWGFASKGSRGLGISALFAGPSGTGKTMAGEVLANELRLDLYRIDLSQVVSKYIGETEKNLRRVFNAAEEGASILLFDEADALFGKRSEVKDSHDRYANIEISYLLQRMEAYRGLAILTTNRKSALDQAFMRRIRFVVEFPFPEAVQRAEIWRRVFPPLTPTEDLRIERLARLNATGGHIWNIAMSAAFLAADAGQPVRMTHLLQAARSEFAKSEKPLTDSEIAGWM
jgi:hypothetical protein